MKKGQKKLIGIVRNYTEEAIFLYFSDGTYCRIDCDTDMTTDEDAILQYQKYGDILERNQKITNAVNKIKNIK